MIVRGFTMLEVLIVMSIVAVIGAFGLFMSMETFQGTNFRSDRDLLVLTLERARAQAIHNECLGACTDGKPHGVHIQSNSYTIFQGTTYNAADVQNVTFTGNASITRTPSTLDIIFTQLSGSTTPQSITLSGQGKTSVISVSSNGRIAWTN